MREGIVERAPRRWARVAGLLYLYIIVAGIFAELGVRGRLVVGGDAAATARNLLAHETLFRIGFTGEMLHLAADVGVAVLLYALLRPVDRTVALAAAAFRFACDVVLGMSSLAHFAALRLVKAGPGLDGLPADAANDLALLALKLHGDGYAISLVFFAFACLTGGWLIFRSGFLPRWLGGLMAIAGVGYLVDTFSHFLAPAFAATLFPALFVPIFVAELSLTLWLLAKGVDEAAWRAAAADPATGGGPPR